MPISVHHINKVLPLSQIIDFSTVITFSHERHLYDCPFHTLVFYQQYPFIPQDFIFLIFLIWKGCFTLMFFTHVLLNVIQGAKMFHQTILNHMWGQHIQFLHYHGGVNLCGEQLIPNHVLTVKDSLQSYSETVLRNLTYISYLRSLLIILLIAKVSPL